MNVLRFHRFGPPLEVLQHEQAEPARLATGCVRLRVLAAPINPADLNFIEGKYGVKPELPSCAGIEGCGEVIESSAPGFQPGDRCLFLERAELWADEVAVPAAALHKLPGGLDPLQAAMLKVNPATAWLLLHALPFEPKGSWIVQNAANSAVGRCVIQLARELGIRTINLVRRTSQIPGLVMLGADHVLLDDDNAVESVKAITGSVPPVLALNAVGGESALRLMNALGPGGTHVTYGAMGRRPLTVPNGLLIFKDLRIRGLWLTRWIENAPRDEVAALYDRLAGLMLEGKLSCPVDRSYPLEEFPAALKRLDDPERSGKVLFKP